MDTAAKIIVTACISNVYLLFQSLIIVQMAVKPAVPAHVPNGFFSQIRTLQLLVVLITISATALQSFLYTRLGFSTRTNVGLSLLVFDLSVFLVFYGQFKIRGVLLSNSEGIGPDDPMKPVPALALSVAVLCLIAGVYQSLA